MTPRLITDEQCPHCGAPLPSENRPRVCPSCAGSLQQRYLRAGCLSSAPKLLLGLVLAALWAVFG
ncbi:MAG: hypothetical protein AAF368_02305 [Planctomycetota bacterium]